MSIVSVSPPIERTTVVGAMNPKVLDGDGDDAVFLIRDAVGD
jgi:hypothetical protein